MALENFALTNIWAIILGFLVFFLIAFIALYIYFGIALMTLAKRLNAENSWLAWVPIGNLVLTAKLAKMPWWPILLLIGGLIPFIGIFFNLAFGIFFIIWIWKICEARNKPGWWAILIIIPLLGLIWSMILIGILAWDKE